MLIFKYIKLYIKLNTLKKFSVTLILSKITFQVRKKNSTEIKKFVIKVQVSSHA